MKKKAILIPLALLLVVSLIACAAPAPAPAPAPTTTVTAPAAPATTVTVTVPAPAPAPAPAMKLQKWSYLIFGTSITSPQDVDTQAAFDRIKERTGGLLDIKISPLGEIPIKGPDQLRAVKDGEVAMFLMFGGYHAGDFPLLRMTDIPFTWFDEYEKSKVWYATLPIVQREADKLNLHILPAIRTNEKYLMMLTEPTDSVMDLEKRKMRSYSKPNGMVIEAMNGVPVNIAWGETFTALERGTADGLLTGWGPLYQNKFMEVAPYAYNISFMSNLQYIVVNKDMWEALPKDVQDIMNEEINKIGALNLAHQAVYEQSLAGLMIAGGLKNYDPGPPSAAFFEVMSQQVTAPLITEIRAEVGPLADEMLQAIEAVLGRKIVE